MTRWAATLCLLIIIGIPTSATASPNLRPRQIAEIRALVHKAMGAQRAPGVTVAVGLNDRVLWTEGFGFSDIENHVRATPATAYRTASIGKSMTATAAMKLVELGKLDLDVPIQTYCPRFPKKPWPITARDLISHTSGIRHYEGPNEQAELFNQKHYDEVSDALEIFENDPLKQQPGDDFLYSTWGYVTLGCVLEGATHESYRALMQRLVFDPAAMAQTRDDDPRAIIPDRARGYILEGGMLKNARWVDMSSKLPAGGWVTTAPDLVRFANAWMAGRLVSPTTMAVMLTPYRLPRHKGTVDNFGMGWFLDTYHAMPMGLYGGGTPEVSGFLMFVPAKKLTVAVLFNLEDVPTAKRADLADAVADVVLGERTPNRGYYNSH
jgi:serine beta-lactamase-like protein LACTB